MTLTTTTTATTTTTTNQQQQEKYTWVKFWKWKPFFSVDRVHKNPIETESKIAPPLPRLGARRRESRKRWKKNRESRGKENIAHESGGIERKVGRKENPSPTPSRRFFPIYSFKRNRAVLGIVLDSISSGRYHIICSVWWKAYYKGPLVYFEAPWICPGSPCPYTGLKRKPADRAPSRELNILLESHCRCGRLVVWYQRT